MKYIKTYEAKKKIKRLTHSEIGDIYYSQDERRWKTTGLNEQDYEIGDFVYVRVKDHDPIIAEIDDYEETNVSLNLINYHYPHQQKGNTQWFDKVVVIRKLTPDEIEEYKEIEPYKLKRTAKKYNL